MEKNQKKKINNYIVIVFIFVTLIGILIFIPISITRRIESKIINNNNYYYLALDQKSIEKINNENKFSFNLNNEIFICYKGIIEQHYQTYTIDKYKYFKNLVDVSDLINKTFIINVKLFNKEPLILNIFLT